MARKLDLPSPSFLLRDDDDEDEIGKKAVEVAAPPPSEDDLLRLIPIDRLTVGDGDGSTRNKKLLVLDLNGLLAHTFFAYEKVDVPRSRLPDGVLGRKYVFKRPFCDEFVRFCFDRFEVAVWSSAMMRNVEGVIRCVMGTLKDRLLFIWDQSECTDSGFKTLEKKDKPLFLKELKKIWNGRYKGRRFSPSDTLLIDDSPYKAILNPPNTAIFPLPYKVADVDDASLGPNGELRVFLEGLAAAAGEEEDEEEGVPSYVGSHPLGQGAITSAHPDWTFYSKIIRRFAGAGATSALGSTTKY